VCPSTVNEFRKRGNNGKEGVNELSMQALTELVDKLNTAELEVEKAPHLTCVSKRSGKMVERCATHWTKICGRVCTYVMNLTLLKM